MKNDLVIFEDHNIRRAYDEKTETWLFSVIDIWALIQSVLNPKAEPIKLLV